MRLDDLVNCHVPSLSRGLPLRSASGEDSCVLG
jgi:hypothetical protein